MDAKNNCLAYTGVKKRIIMSFTELVAGYMQ